MENHVTHGIEFTYNNTKWMEKEWNNIVHYVIHMYFFLWTNKIIRFYDYLIWNLNIPSDLSLILQNFPWVCSKLNIYTSNTEIQCHEMKLFVLLFIPTCALWYLRGPTTGNRGIHFHNFWCLVFLFIFQIYLFIV